MSTSDKFNKFCSNIVIDSVVVSNISYRYKRITRQLNKDFWSKDCDTQNSLYIGSYGRHTDIHTSDIDVFQLPCAVYQRYNSYQGNGQSALLQAVKNSIEKTYRSFIKGDGQVLKINFTDGICFELVLARNISLNLYRDCGFQNMAQAKPIAFHRVEAASLDQSPATM